MRFPGIVLALSAAMPIVSVHAQAPPGGAAQVSPVVLQHFSRHVKYLKKIHDERMSAGNRDTKAGDYYKNTAQLSKAEADALEGAALTIVDAFDAIDARAAAVIQTARPAQLNRRLLPGERPPAPPPELLALQKQRDALALGLRGRLIQSIGTGAFARLERALLAKRQFGNVKAVGTVAGPQPASRIGR